MHAATVELLVKKSRLDPDMALAIATAVDMALKSAQPVTVAVSDARFLALGAKMDARFAAVDSRFGTLVADTQRRFAQVESDAAHERSKSELFWWGVLISVCNVAFTLAANAVVNATVQHLR